MNEILKYLDYCGSIETSVKDDCLHGQILHIRDKITYEGKTLKELRDAFESSVDEYIETCKEIGREPQKSFSGSFNVRIGPDLHRLAAIEAVRQGITLNELVKKAVGHFVDPKDSRRVSHFHYHSWIEELNYESENIENLERWQQPQITLQH